VRTVGLIARREITTRLQQKGYRISVGVTLLIVMAACIVPSFIGGSGKSKTYDIGLSSMSAPLGRALASTASTLHITLRLHASTAAQAQSKVHAGDWDAAVVGASIIAQHKTDAVVGLIEQAHVVAETNGQLRQAGLSASQIQKALRVTPLQVTTTASDSSTQRAAIATIAVVALFTQLITFCTWVAMGVVEEKSSRVVELVLSSVRPLRLLAGKLLGIGALAVAQVTLLGVVALVTANAAGTLTVPASAISTVLVSLVGFVFGFAFFAALAAGLAATVSRQEEVSAILAPVTITMTACYLASFTVANNAGSVSSRILSIVPPISAIAMPARVARGGVPVLDVVAAIVLLSIATLGVVLVGARVYRASVLHSGSRMKLRDAWRGEAVAPDVV